ncbi:MAG: lipoyl(octanoyl) transferase [Eubacteriales bacterium]|nr:lipoyl(octanoyl) transferase [Eubacteriales bacterium]MDN5363862.1 lipoyl(octanoyl) transferase [Eubacteriales bacterium]
MSEKIPACFLWLERIDFTEAYPLQKGAARYVSRFREPELFLLLEHDPVFTLGRQAKKDHILAPPELLDQEGIKVVATDRGGDVTYHGPGQLVGYPLLDLRRHGRDLHRLIWMYEEIIIRVLAEFGLAGTREPRYPGVWIGDRKIAAIGIGVSRWITYHGFAFNINPNLEHFSYIVPCGIREKGVTSLARELGQEVAVTEVIEPLRRHAAVVLNLEWVETLAGEEALSYLREVAAWRE